MANLLEDVIAFYVDLGLVTALATDAFVDNMPDEPDTCLAVYEFVGGPRPAYSDIATRKIQVMCRAKSQVVARQNAIEFYNAIIPDAQRQDLTVQRWTVVESNTVPSKIKIDTKGRSYYMFDLELTTYIDYN